MILHNIEKIVWGAPLLLILLFLGIYLTWISKGVQVRYLFYSLKLAFGPQEDSGKGDITHFQALMTALAATIGIGSIAGVATAIAVGGLGALFWLWVAAFLGMATKYGEAILAVKYRITDRKGGVSGGPMYYLEKSLPSKKLSAALATFFSVAGAITAFGTGNMVQAHSVSSALFEYGLLSPWASGILLSLLTGIALFGGIKSIGKIASYLVPIMGIFYVGGGLLVLGLCYAHIPTAFSQILSTAFTGQAATGGFAGSTIFLAAQYGISRGVFSSEAGLGSAPIADAAAKTDMPARQALVSMSGVFLTSFIVCTITGLAIATSGVLGQVDGEGRMLDGSIMVIRAFNQTLPGSGVIITISLLLFAYSTILGWAYYGEKCMEYLFGLRSVFYYRVLFTLFLIPGSLISLSAVWSFSNIMNGLMALPNLVGLFALSRVIAKETELFDAALQQEWSSEKRVAL